MLLHDIIENCGVVPVVVLEDANKAVPYSREESRPARLLLELLPQKKLLDKLH